MRKLYENNPLTRVLAAGTLAAVLASCTGKAPESNSATTTAGTRQETATAARCSGSIGKMSLIDPAKRTFKVESVVGSEACKGKEVPPADLIVAGTFQKTGEQDVPTFSAGDTFDAVCGMGKLPVLMVSSVEGVGSVRLLNEDVKAAVTQAQVPLCTGEQIATA